MMRSKILIYLRVYVRVKITNNWLWAFFVLDISIKKWMCSMICHNYIVITTEKCFDSKPWLSIRKTGSWFYSIFSYMTSIRNAYTVENHFNDYPCSSENEQVPLTGFISNSNTNPSLDLFLYFLGTQLLSVEISICAKRTLSKIMARIRNGP